MSVEVEYEVVVGTDKVVATLKQSGKENEFTESVTIDEQRGLQLDTIEVLRSWLVRWTALTRVTSYKQLTVGNTATVLGRHLYAVVFTGQVGRGLTEARTAARTERTTLRLLLSFKESAEDLAQLPWELLNADGEFLASEHRLVISRRLPVTRRTLEPPEPPLMVHFLVTVPETEAYRQQRDELIAALDRPMEYTTSISHRVLKDWHESAAIKLLSTPPYPQIVHIIGVCRPMRDTPGSMQIFLDDGEGEGPQWRSAQTLLNIFRENEGLPERDQVRLVVLHLCEPSPLDFEVTFERLAPALIRRGIPAVLAMQYPLSGKAAGRFVKQLYEALPDVGTIEEAVQRARSYLFTNYEQDRLFGSPVLYMQTMNSQLLKLPTGSPAGADAGPSSVSAAQPPPGSVLDWLVQRLGGLNQPMPLRREVEQIMADLQPWPAQLSEVKRLLARQVREYAYRPDLAEVFRLLVGAVNDQFGGSDD